MRKLFLVGILVFVLSFSGCTGLGLSKKTTVMPDEIWFTGDTDFNGEVSEIGFGIKWKFNK